MANRFWVGGSADWDATAGTKWALTSGGAGGQAVPTATDDVFFDANSGAVTIGGTVTRNCLSIDFTGFTGVWGGTGQLSARGNVKFSPTMTATWAGTLTFQTNSAQLTTAGIVTPGTVQCVVGAANTLTLMDDLTCLQLTHSSGTIDAATHSADIVATRGYNATGATAKVITLGPSFVAVGTDNLFNGFEPWNDASTGGSLTVNAGTCEITLQNDPTVWTGAQRYTSTFDIAGNSFHKIIVEGERGVYFSGSGTIGTLELNPSGRCDVKIAAAAVLDIGVLTIVQVPGEPVTFRTSPEAGAAATIDLSATPALTLDHAAFRNIAFTGGDVRAINDSVDFGGNSGITFERSFATFGGMAG